MNVQRVAAILTLGVGAVAGCSSFSGSNGESSSSGNPVEAGTETETGTVPDDGGAKPAPLEAGSDAGPEFSCAALPEADAGINRRCWDFTPSNVADGLNLDLSTGGSVVRDDVAFLSSPASFHARIQPSAGQVRARGVFELPPPLKSGTYSMAISVLTDCLGSGDSSPPTLLELYCAGPKSGALIRLERPDANGYRVTGADVSKSLTATITPASILTSTKGWTRIGIAVSLFEAGAAKSKLRLDLDGSEGSTVDLSQNLRCGGEAGTKLQLLLGVQDTNGTAVCDVHYDNVVFEYPK